MHIKMPNFALFFPNSGSNSAPIQNWLNYKIVTRQFGTNLGTFGGSVLAYKEKCIFLFFLFFGIWLEIVHSNF